MPHYAHTAEDPNGNRLGKEHWQLLKDHLLNVAQKAAAFASKFGMQDEAYLAGLLHDLGKYRDLFQEYLDGKIKSSPATRHAIFGAAISLDKQLPSSLLAIAGHHAGLHNLFEALADAQKAGLPEEARFLIKTLQADARITIPVTPPVPLFLEKATSPELATEVYTRMLFSCLVDADRLDTAYFPGATPGEQPLDADRLLAKLEAERRRKQQAHPSSPLSEIRNAIFDECMEKGKQAQGFFSLTVPTGGGKTLSAMNFALSHARTHQLDRVIVVIPYLSIIEQNASEYRRIFGEDIVLEQHSAVECPEDCNEEERAELERISETWDAPIVVTTSVQFIESLFARNPSRCRKLHRIARSVVIFDEVQTLPAHLLQPCLSVFRELAANYQTSFVFSTATQPAFRVSASLKDGFMDGELREIVTAVDSLFPRLSRTRYHLPESNKSINWPELAEKLAQQKQVLCVVNLTRHARELWEQLKRKCDDSELPIHLASGMCPQHRLQQIQSIRERLAKGLPCRVVSTQLIEAGVDVDFPILWRAMGPLDSLVQAAGRCNREGKLRDAQGNPVPGNVFIFIPEENKLPPGIYRSATDQARVSLAALGDSEHAGKCLADSPQVFHNYFSALYQLIETDTARIQEDRLQLRFRDVAQKARVIEDSGHPVIIAGDATTGDYAAPIIEEIRNRRPEVGQARFNKEDLRRLQRCIVNVREHDFQKLQGLKAIYPLLPNLELHVLDRAFYHPQLGLLIENHPIEIL